ncbi:UPF0158 family protein [Bacillus sp. V5-8f]|uniref:UPF0158 family protein n=1 Tax=Bacillus sp. V5-8f TaxID=2053044 RepID=UPI000C77C53C|nr:UPF0158 family protein [Bacillus sp. V5-8f]PLT32054.1 hypothetical protein CUU64_21010 [Bacillus sp. V5-8f]
MINECFGVNDLIIRNKLLGAIKGTSAFRRFKDHIIDIGIEETWYSFRYERYKETVINWCKDNNIAYVE